MARRTIASSRKGGWRRRDCEGPALQDLLIDQASVVEDREEAAHQTADIENFIRGARVVGIAKPAATREA